MAVTGKTGADAISKDIHDACKTYQKYESKFQAVIVAAQTAGAIDSTQALAIQAFVGGISVLCIAMEALANYSGF